ncbi:hypothetical protein OK074_8469 [Actinobacteria bacterium OK074]|nr:hypothetical protein OK074_8469 [Actinobacteria bacterium OK074]
MGALRLNRVLAGAGLAVVAVGGVAACDPGGLNAAAAAYTTDETATAELNRQNVSVSWLSCTGDYGNGSAVAPSPSATVVAVDCKGQTKDGKDIKVTGRITRAVDGKCVRGELTATVGGKRVFQVSGLGNCDQSATPSSGVSTPPVTYRPSTPGQATPTVTVTVTVTQTVWCKGDPTCWPVVPGK